MLKKKAIKLGKGLDEIRFGISKNEIEKILGAPSLVDTIENDQPELGESHVWHYDSMNLSFTFEEIDEFRLGMISVNKDSYSIEELIRVGMQKQKVLDLLEELNILFYAEEDHSTLDNPNHTLVAVDHKSLYLWFDNDQLSEIQWFPFYNEEEEIIWPK